LEATKHYAIELGTLYTEHPIFAAASDAAYAEQAIVTTSTTKAKLLALSHISAWLL